MSVRNRVRHPLFARGYDRMSARSETLGVAHHRAELLAGVVGRVIEVGAGNGANFSHYPPTVSEVVAVEPEPYLRERALAAARRAPVPVHVVTGIAEDLPAADESFDVAVASLVLCSVRDQLAAVRELARVLRPGGEVRFYEHVLSEDGRLSRWQHRLAPVQSWTSGGCHPDRDTLRALELGGLRLEHVHRFTFRPMALAVLSSPHAIGTARKAQAPAGAAGPAMTGRQTASHRCSAGCRHPAR